MRMAEQTGRSGAEPGRWEGPVTQGVALHSQKQGQCVPMDVLPPGRLPPPSTRPPAPRCSVPQNQQLQLSVPGRAR